MKRLSLAVLSALALGLAACNNPPNNAEEAGERVDAATEEAAEDAEGAAERAGEAIDNAAAEAERNLENAGEAIEREAQDLKEDNPPANPPSNN